jgi:hypothetical protein
MHSLPTLILDIKTVIASYDIRTWYQLYRYDPAFRAYAQTSHAINLFIALFTIKTTTYNTEEYRLFDYLHRDNDLPALIRGDGTQAWYRRGQLHRCDLPAIITANGNWYWYQQNQRHRDNDLPAIIYATGDQEWYQHGKLHRCDLPAVIYADGRRDWYQHGQRHRDNDLPAIIHANGDQEWYQHNIEVSFP